MYRNLYDTDTITWSPQGRIFQVEYAMEAVKQGTCCVAARSKNQAVICCLKRAPSKLAECQEKTIKIYDHIGLALSGITADAKSLGDFMMDECQYHTFKYGSKMPLSALIPKVAEKYQLCTQSSSRRPYGVGLLIAGYDQDGPHLFECCPSGIYTEALAISFGGRSQSARTYLEKHCLEFDQCSTEKLIFHALSALKTSIAPDTELNHKTISIAIVGHDQDFTVLDINQTNKYIQDMIASENLQPDVNMTTVE